MRILVVDDDPLVLRMCRRILVREDYEVVTTQEPREALNLIEDGEDGFDVMLCDIIMPEMTGGELANEIEQRGLDVEIIFMSGHAGNDSAVDRITNGYAAFLEKPFMPQNLVDLIESVTRK